MLHFFWLARLKLNCVIAETLLRPAAEEDGGSRVNPPRSVAELHAGLEVGLPGQHDGRGLRPGGSVCYRGRRPGIVLTPGLK